MAHDAHQLDGTVILLEYSRNSLSITLLFCDNTNCANL